MTTTPQCPQCSAPLAADAPQGLCPHCLAKVGLGSGAETKAATKPPSTPPPLPPRTAPDLTEIAKHFPQLEILEFIGAGGMGALYKARQKQLDRVIALKILPPESGRDPEFAERFLREARALAKLNHPNIVTVHEFGETDGLFYLIMEYVDGVNLRQMEQSAKLTPAEALVIIPKICDALQYAHDEGVVHRDIKPANILIDKKGRVKLADFGLAKLLGKSQVDFTLTGTNQAMGTPQYMAPEQVEKPLTVDHRADIYSLGVVFYEMLTGELPMGRFALPSHTLHVDVRLDEVVLKTLEKEPDRRYQHVSQVKTDVENVTSQPAVAAQVKSKYRPAVMIPVGLGVVLILALVWWLSQRTPGKSSVSALTWRATLTQAETAYDENRFEEAIGLFDAALTAMSADQKANPSVLKIARDKASKDRELAGFILDRSKLPVSQQIELTQQKLAEFNTNYTGKGTFAVTKDGRIIVDLQATGIADPTPLKGLPMSELRLDMNPVVDLEPLRGQPLKSLNICSSSVVSLSPLKGMTSLTNLICCRTGIQDIAPLQGLPLKGLHLWGTGVSDLSPLTGMPLEWLQLGFTQVSDLRPLKGMHLLRLQVGDSPVTDISPLRGMPLVELDMTRSRVTDLSPLRTLKALTVVNGIDLKPLLNDLYTALRTNNLAQAKREATSLIADCQSVPAFSNVVAEAREIQTALAQLANGDTGPYFRYWFKHLNERGVVRTLGYGCDTNGLINIDLHGGLISSNATLDALHYIPLRSLGIGNDNLINLQTLAGLPLTHLWLDNNPVADLSPLRGMKLEVLYLNNTLVENLAPLQGMPLKFLDLHGTKVIDLNPLHGMKLDVLGVGRTAVTDLAPVKGMPLKTLYLDGSKVADLSPLKGMPLETLDLSATPVSDLRPLQGMPLKWLAMRDCPVIDFPPLQGLPLTAFFAGSTGIADLTPLAGMPLENLDLSGATNVASIAALRGMKLTRLVLDETQVSDLTILQGMPLKELFLRGSRAVDLRPLAGMPLERLGLDRTPATNLPSLKGAPLTSLGLPNTKISDLTPLAGLPLREVYLSDTPVADLSPLNGAPLTQLDASRTKVSDLTPLKGAPLDFVAINNTLISDLRPLANAPIHVLQLDNTRVSDLTPLKDIPLAELQISGTPVTDLSPLKNVPFRFLAMNNTKVTDLSPLAGNSSLRDLQANDTPLTDLSPLKGMSLATICIGRTKVRDLSPLKGMKSLTRIFEFDIAAVLLADLRRAVEVKDHAAVKTLATQLIADWQDVPAMADVVKQAKEMLGAVEK